MRNASERCRRWSLLFVLAGLGAGCAGSDGAPGPVLRGPDGGRSPAPIVDAGLPPAPGLGGRPGADAGSSASRDARVIPPAEPTPPDAAPSGPLNCLQLVDCEGSCNDEACRASCATRATAAARTKFQGILDCARKYSCQESDCLTARCNAELVICVSDSGDRDGGGAPDAALTPEAGVTPDASLPADAPVVPDAQPEDAAPSPPDAGNPPDVRGFDPPPPPPTLPTYCDASGTLQVCDRDGENCYDMDVSGLTGSGPTEIAARQQAVATCNQQMSTLIAVSFASRVSIEKPCTVDRCY
jgi:hypothetical protein